MTHPPTPGLNPTSGNLGFVLAVVTVAALGGFLFGFDTAVINGAVPALQKLYMDAQSNFAGGLPLTQDALNTASGLAVSLALVGAAIGAFVAGPITNHYGRKKAMVVAAILFFISAIGSGLPVTIWDFTLWRVLGGLAFGAASVIAPAYIAEVSPARLRGRLGSMQQLAIVVGIFIALMSNYILVQVTPGKTADGELLGIAAWRWMFWVEALPSAVYGVLALGIPESPRYLVTKDRDAEARAVLTKVLGHEAAQAKIAEIHATLASDHRPRLSDILANTLHGKKGFLFLGIVWLGIGLSVFQQFVGINVVFYYSNLLWQSVGYDESKALLLTLIGGTTNVVTTFIAIALVDKIGRKPLLAMGSVGMVLSLAAMAFAFSTAPLNTESPTVEISRGAVPGLSLSVVVEQGKVTSQAVLTPTQDDFTTPVEQSEPTSEPGALRLNIASVIPDPTKPALLTIGGLPDGVILKNADRGNDGSYTFRTKVQPNLQGESAHLGTIALIALNVFVFSFGFSWGPIVWVMLGEMFSNQVRGAGLAVAAAAQWAANFLISTTFPIMAGISLGVAYGFYAFCAAISLVFVLTLIPETKGKELEQMGELEAG